MPIHVWAKVPSGLFHHFHQDWSIEIARTLNHGRLPKGLTALVEQKTGTKEGDILAIESKDTYRRKNEDRGGTLTLERPVTRIVRRSDQAFYADKANRIVIRHHLGRIVAVIEIVSPGNKDGVKALRDFVEKIASYIDRGIRVVVIDLFPPTKRDPFGIHKAIWDQIVEEDFTFPPNTDRVMASYEAGTTKTAFVEPIGVGDTMRDMPLFVEEGIHVWLPLDSTYQTSWNATPEAIREAVRTGVLPSMSDE